MKRLFIILFCITAGTVYGQAKLGDFINKTRNNVNNVKNKADKVETTVEKTGIDPVQDTTKKNDSKKTEDTKKTDNLAIGDEGDADNKKDNKTKQTKEFIKDSKGGTTTTPPPGGGSLVDPNSQKKNIAIGDEGAEDDKVKNKEKNNSISPK